MDASSSSHKPETTPPLQDHYQIPSSFFLLPLGSAGVGMIIGLRRGGRTAQLRFLAENAHRQPRTKQGWYFYNKTRNYKVLHQAAKTGVQYGLGLGGIIFSLVFLEEYVSWAREEWFGVIHTRGSEEWSGLIHSRVSGEGSGAIHPVEPEEGARKKMTWRRGGIGIEDGAIAGGIWGFAVALIFKLPVSTISSYGAIGGALHTGLEYARDLAGDRKLQQLREAKGEITREEVQPPQHGTRVQREALQGRPMENQRIEAGRLQETNAILGLEQELEQEQERKQEQQEPRRSGWTTWIPGVSG